MAAVTQERANALRAEWRRIATWAAVLKRAGTSGIPLGVIEAELSAASQTWPELVAAELLKHEVDPA